MPEQKEKKEVSESESDLKSSPQQTAPSQHYDSREERLGLWSDDPKLQ